MILLLPYGLWVGWARRLNRNSSAAIFKVDVFLERTIHLESEIVKLKSSNDFVEAVRAVGGVGPPSQSKLTGCDLQSGFFLERTIHLESDLV